MQVLNPSGMKLPKYAVRIICLVPSLTETLAYLGLEKETVGITKFCVHPATWFQSKLQVGGTKNVAIEKVKSLRPDLVIASKEENVQDQVKAISHFCPVLLTDIVTIQDAVDDIMAIGKHTGKTNEAEKLAQDIQENFSSLQITQTKKAVYLIWRNPWMLAGGDTYIHQMMLAAGYENIFAEHLRYPETSLEALANMDVDTILLSSEPYPFTEKHLAEVAQALPHAQVRLVNGEMFSWYGSRMLQAAPYFRTLHKIDFGVAAIKGGI
jgi:ABC-type Fe3+-hydroxamate transport system substrate-binding protein